MQNSEFRVKFQKRLKDFAVKIVKLANSLPKTPAGFAIASQIVRSGTSIGANAQEAQSALSRKEFVYCLNISLKEARETLYWLSIVTESDLSNENLSLLLSENDEIIKILVSIVRNAKNNSAL